MVKLIWQHGWYWLKCFFVFAIHLRKPRVSRWYIADPNGRNRKLVATYYEVEPINKNGA